MQNKGFNPLFLSALDILTGALSVFIILNFLQTRLPNQPPKPSEKEKIAQKESKKTPTTDPQKSGTGVRPAAPVSTGTYKPTPPPSTHPTTGPSPVSVNPTSGQAATAPPKPEVPKPVEERPYTPPQDPVAVDLMRQTQGAVVLLMQQPDRAKNGVEFMLRQGNRTWKPTRASKYQDNDFQYQKSLNYFAQKELTPGMYEVLVRVKRSERSTSGVQRVAFFGKIVPNGLPARTYNFGQYSINNGSDDWVSAGTMRISSNVLEFQSRLPAATAQSNETPNPAPTTTPSAPKAKPEKGKTGKWGK